MIELVLQKDNKLTSENRNLFSTYPSNIAKEIDISRPTAGDACKMFSKIAILEVANHNYTHKRGGKSNFYSLKSNLLTIRKLVKLIIEQLPYSEAQRLLDNYYFTYKLNESLVREVLYEKDVSICRTFYALDWNINDAHRILNTFARNDGYSYNHEIVNNFIQNIEESIKSYEKDNKETESEYIGQIKDFCDSFNQDLNDPNFDEVQYYFKEYDFYNLSKSRYYTGNYPSTRYLFIDVISPFPLKLPVFNDSISEIEIFEKIKKMNLDIFCYTYYGDAYERLKSLPRNLILELNTSISRLEEIQIEIIQSLNQNKLVIISHTDLPFNDLIEKLHYYKNKVEADQLQHNTLAIYNIIKRDIDKLNELISEQFNSIKQENIDDFLVDKLNLIESRFRYILQKLDDFKNIREPEDQYILRNYNKTLQEHYSVFQYERLILPILVLIQSSPLALYEFLNGDWDSFELSFFDDQQKAKNSAFLAKLVHIAFIDIISKPCFFEKGIVESISFDSFCPSCINYFQTSGLDDYEKYVDYRHKILDGYYNELSYNKLRIIEGTSLKIKLKHIYELSLYLSFVAINKNDKPEIFPSLALNVLPEIEYNLFRMDRIKDMCSFISKLKKTNIQAYSHVRELFPLKVQNTMLHLDLSCRPSLRLKQEILNEFNLIVLKPELYQKGIFDSFIGSSDDFKEGLDDLSFKDVIQMVHSNSSSGLLMKLLINNKRLLERMFEDDIETEIIY